MSRCEFPSRLVGVELLGPSLIRPVTAYRTPGCSPDYAMVSCDMTSHPTHCGSL